jgi:hypothetical protein
MPISQLKLLNKAVEYARRTPAFVAKHPVASATGVGAAFALNKADTDMDNTEKSIMNEYAGVGGSKYAGLDYAQFAMHKQACYNLIKQAKKEDGDVYNPRYKNDPRYNEDAGRGDKPSPTWGQNIAGSAQQQLGRGLVGELIGAVRRLLGASSQKAVDVLVNDPVRNKIVASLIASDPYIAEFEKNKPGQAAAAYKTMRQVAPTLSTDPNVVQSFLRAAAMSGGVLDFSTVKTLADAETSVHKAKNEGAWLRGGF